MLAVQDNREAPVETHTDVAWSQHRHSCLCVPVRQLAKQHSQEWLCYQKLSYGALAKTQRRS